MKTYLVEWSIVIEAETPREAAEIARTIQRDPESGATYFHVHDPENNKTINVDIGYWGPEEE